MNTWTPREESIDLIHHISRVTMPHENVWPLSLKQIHYLLMDQNILQQKHYRKLQRVLARARMDNSLPWDLLDDARGCYIRPTWENFGMFSLSEQERGAFSLYVRDYLGDQSQYMEVWVEKDAIARQIHRGLKDTVFYGTPVIETSNHPSATQKQHYYNRVQKHLDQGKGLVLVVLADYDDQGNTMVGALAPSLKLHYDLDVTVHRVACLSEDHPRVELEAFPPTELVQKTKAALIALTDMDKALQRKTQTLEIENSRGVHDR